jgi:hypothetical protein
MMSRSGVVDIDQDGNTACQRWSADAAIAIKNGGVRKLFRRRIGGTQRLSGVSSPNNPRGGYNEAHQ